MACFPNFYEVVYFLTYKNVIIRIMYIQQKTVANTKEEKMTFLNQEDLYRILY